MDSKKLRDAHQAALAAILLAGFILRLIRLWERDLWYDEAFAILYAKKSLGAILYGTVAQVEGAAADVHPLLYYFSLHFWMGLFGGSVFVVRFFSVIFGLLTVAVAYRLAKELFGRRTALAAAGLTAFAPFHINYSQEGRMYAMFCFWSILAVYFFVRAWRRGRWGDWAGFTLAGTLSLYTQNLAFAPLLALVLFALAWILARKKWAILKPLFLSYLVMALLFAPWVRVLATQFGKVRQAYWVARPGAAELFRTLIYFTFNQPLPTWLLPTALFLSLALLVFSVYRLVRSREREGIWLVAALAFLPVGMLFLISQFKSVYIERGMLPTAVAYYLFLAAIWTPRRARGKAALLLIPFALVGTISLQYHYTYAGFPRSPFRDAVAYMRANLRPGDVIIHDNKLTFFPCYYYDRSLPQTFVPDPPGAGSDTLAYPTQEALGLFATPLEEAAGRHRQIWFVIFQKAFEEKWFRELGYEEHPDKAWLDEHYRQVKLITFNDLNVYLYEK